MLNNFSRYKHDAIREEHLCQNRDVGTDTTLSIGHLGFPEILVIMVYYQCTSM